MFNGQFVHPFVYIFECLDNFTQTSFAVEFLPDCHCCLVEHLHSAPVRIKQQGTVIILDAKHKVGIDCQKRFQINFLVKVFQNKLPHPQ